MDKIEQLAGYLQKAKELIEKVDAHAQEGVFDGRIGAVKHPYGTSQSGFRRVTCSVEKNGIPVFYASGGTNREASYRIFCEEGTKQGDDYTSEYHILNVAGGIIGAETVLPRSFKEYRELIEQGVQGFHYWVEADDNPNITLDTFFDRINGLVNEALQLKLKSSVINGGETAADTVDRKS